MTRSVLFWAQASLQHVATSPPRARPSNARTGASCQAQTARKHDQCTDASPSRCDRMWGDHCCRWGRDSGSHGPSRHARRDFPGGWRDRRRRQPHAEVVRVWCHVVRRVVWHRSDAAASLDRANHRFVAGDDAARDHLPVAYRGEEQRRLHTGAAVDVYDGECSHASAAATTTTCTAAASPSSVRGFSGVWVVDAVGSGYVHERTARCVQRNGSRREAIPNVASPDRPRGLHLRA